MAEIHILDSASIDKIAAGEVVERPVSVVKELVENAIDAGAEHVTVEIKDGGISLIRVTDDGSGIEKDQITKAFYRHATSKIESADDLAGVMSLGFRGEALSSISAVSRVELITKTKDELTGSRFVIEGGNEGKVEEIGAPEGTTVVVRELFYNTPARRKFLKTANTEGGYIYEYMQHLALGSPKVSFQFVTNGQTKFFTSGNGDIKEIIYRIWGREVSNQLIPYEASMDGAVIKGYIGKPILARANRTFETLFVNGRFIKSILLSTAIEEGYRTLLMQHKYPFVVLHFSIDPARLDVNVHPTKLDIRISDPGELLKLTAGSISETLTGGSLIQPALPKDIDKTKDEIKQEKKEELQKEKELTRALPQPFENKAREALTASPEDAENNEASDESKGVVKETVLFGDLSQNTVPDNSGDKENGNEKSLSSVQGNMKEETTELFDNAYHKDLQGNIVAEKSGYSADTALSENKGTEVAAYTPRVIGKPVKKPGAFEQSNIYKQRDLVFIEKPKQMELFDEVDIRQQEIDNFVIVGQVFDTYWIIAMGDKIYYVDQHAAHEKVMYERLMKHYRQKEIYAQSLEPPIALELTPTEALKLSENREAFSALGFETEPFGEDSFALRSVPMDLYGHGEKELFLSALDALMEGPARSIKDSDAVLMKIASMSCKAAVKGNMKLSPDEARALIKEMLECDNPYHCPHGRPTMISVSKQEMEKRFHR